MMSRRRILIIITFSSLSLAGLVLSQGIWVNNALSLAEKHHNHRVNLALDNILEELTDLKDSLEINNEFSSNKDIQLFDILDTLVLQLLIEKYVNYHELGENYTYAVIKTSSDSVYHKGGIVLEQSEKASYHKACLYCIWKKDYFHLQLGFPKIHKNELLSMSMWLILSGIFILVVAFSLYYIISTVLRQKKISQIRDDFISNITHEFKTPIATISLASEILLKEKSDNPESRIAKYSRVIYDENKKMRAQVEKVLQIALLDKQDYDLEIKDHNLDDLIRNNVRNLCLDHCKDDVEVIDRLNAKFPVVKTDAVHFANVITNLVTNSLKYKKNKPVLVMESENVNNSYIFSFEDNGIGIAKHDLPHIFDKFYRVSTGNIHNAKGFGIGLYYVKKIILAHKGKIDVSSKPGKGTRFEISLPQN